MVSRGEGGMDSRWVFVVESLLMLLSMFVTVLLRVFVNLFLSWFACAGVISLFVSVSLSVPVLVAIVSIPITPSSVALSSVLLFPLSSSSSSSSSLRKGSVCD